MIFDKHHSTITGNTYAQDPGPPLSLALQAVSEDTLYKVSSLFNAFKQMRVEGIDTTEAVVDNNSDVSILNRAFDIHLQTVRLVLIYKLAPIFFLHLHRRDAQLLSNTTRCWASWNPD